MPRRPARGGLAGFLGKQPTPTNEQIFRGAGTQSGGPVGAQGPTGADGREGGINYRFDSATASADPGAGELRLNNAALASVTALYISETDDDGGAIAGLLAALDDSTSTVRGQVIIREVGAPGSFAAYAISGALTDNGTWITLPLTHLASGGSFGSGDELMLSFFRTGDKGDTGAQGATGSQGDPGLPGGTGGAQTFPCQGRLTLASGSPVPVADQTAKSTLYFTPYGGSTISVYDGADWVDYTLSERSLALSGLTANLPYDVFIYDNAGTLTLELTAWTSDTTRATALVLQHGVWVKTGATTRRYLGTIRTTGTTTTEDSAAKRFVWNYYNRRRRPLRAPQETTSTWSYDGGWRQARGSATNQDEVVIGISEDAIEHELHVMFDDASGAGVVAIGVDSTTTPHADSSAGYRDSSGTGNVTAVLGIQPAAGYHKFVWLERTLTAASTFQGQDASVPRRSLLRGSVFA
jgi:hypothetical protein